VSSTNQVPDPEVPARAQTRRYSAVYKTKILEEYESLDKAGKGSLLRREGLYTSLIGAWKKQRDQAVKEALARPAGRPPADTRDKELARLRQRVVHLEGELGKARKVIDIQGKLSSWHCWANSRPTASPAGASPHVDRRRDH
jgi:transposase